MKEVHTFELKEKELLKQKALNKRALKNTLKLEDFSQQPKNSRPSELSL